MLAQALAGGVKVLDEVSDHAGGLAGTELLDAFEVFKFFVASKNIGVGWVVILLAASI